MNPTPILLSAIVAFAATLSAGFFIRKFKSHIGVVCAFSAGFFVALTLFELLPEISALVANAQISLEKPLFTAVGGFFFLFAVDQVFSRFHSKNHNMQRSSIQPRIGLLSTMEFCSHGFIEGLAIGVSFQFQFELGIFVAAAVVSHDFCDGINTLALMLNSGNSVRSSVSMLFADALAPVVGAVVPLFFAIQNFFLVLMLSFLSGSFLYMGGGMLLPDANRMNRPIATIGFFLLGFLLILILSRVGV